MNGLERDAGVLIEKKYMSSQQIKEEYEQLVKDREERALQQRCNPRGAITVFIDATDLFRSDDDEDDDAMIYGAGPLSLFQSLPVVEVRSMSMQQSIEAPLSLKHHFILHGDLNVRNGNGSAQLSAILRHIYSRMFFFLASSPFFSLF